MDEDKVLVFLNLGKEKTYVNSPLKMHCWMDIAITCCIGVFGLLLKAISVSLPHIVILLLFCVADLLFAIWIHKTTNPVKGMLVAIVIHTVSATKLLYGYIVFSDSEQARYGYPRFSWGHFVVLIVIVLLTAYMWIRFYKFFQYLKKYTIKQATDKLTANNPGCFFWIPAIGITPMVLVRLFKGSFESFGLGIGFCLWGLTCCWLFMILSKIPQYVVAQKYKAAQFFEADNTISPSKQ